MRTDFIPTRDGDLDAHEDNFKAKLTLYAASLGLDPTEVTESIAVIDSHRSSYSAMNSRRAISKSASEENRLKKRLAINELRRLAKKIKTSKSYSTPIGEDLQIIGPGIPVQNYQDLKPVIKSIVNGQNVILQFKKDGTDGIKIYSRRGTETEFTYLSLDTSSPYNDNRPKLDSGKPEQREYYANFFLEDKEVGHRSDVIKVVIP